MDLAAIIVSVTEEDGVKMPNILFLPVTKSATKRYHNTLAVLFGLSGCTRDLLDYYTEIMDSRGIVSTDTDLVEQFINKVVRLSANKVRYSTAAVKKAISKLRERGILLNHCRGKGRICPLFFSNQDSEKRRIKEIEATFTWRDTNEKANDNMSVIAKYTQRDGIADIIKTVNKQDILESLRSL
jgi:hypothetical protein